MTTTAAHRDMDSSREALRRSLSNSSKGRLQYDRTWEQDGRGEEIISDINTRLVAIPISPRTDIFARESTGVKEYENVQQTLSDLSLSAADCASPAGDSLDSFASEPIWSPVPSPLEEKTAQFFQESCNLDDEEKRERVIRDRRLSRDTESRMGMMHSEIFQFLELLSQKSPEPALSNVTNRLREVECRKKQLLQEHEQKKQSELRCEVRSLITAIDGEVRRTVKSLEESFRCYRSLKQHVKEAEDHLKSLQASIDSIACKTSFTDEDHLKLREAKESITAACFKVLEKTDALLFVAKQQQQKEQAAAQTHSSSPQVSEAEAGLSASERAGTPAPEAASVASSAESGTFKQFIKCRNFVAEFENKIKTFIDDPAQKSYRLRLQQFIRTQINAISPDSDDHLKQKFQKLQALFHQQDVEFQDKRLSTRDHVLALDFCLDYAARTFLSVGSKQILSVPKAAFSFAAVVALLWEKEERFGQLLLGHLMEKCPYVGGYYPAPDPRDSESDYLICCGYIFGPDKVTLETEESFLNRMRSYVRIYGALVQSKAQHSHGMRHAWIWMTRTLQVQPKPGISAAVIHAFLDVCLHRLFELYRSQCTKLLVFLASDYIPRIEQNSTQDVKKQSVVQLKMFVNESITRIAKKKSLKHEGVLSDYFWQKKYLNS